MSQHISTILFVIGLAVCAIPLSLALIKGLQIWIRILNVAKTRISGQSAHQETDSTGKLAAKTADCTQNRFVPQSLLSASLPKQKSIKKRIEFDPDEDCPFLDGNNNCYYMYANNKECLGSENCRVPDAEKSEESEKIKEFEETLKIVLRFCDNYLYDYQPRVKNENGEWVPDKNYVSPMEKARRLLEKNKK